jgi:hypothetical protein
MDVSDARRSNRLEAENRRLNTLLANAASKCIAAKR